LGTEISEKEVLVSFGYPSFLLMDIVLIGSGNVATALGRKSREAGHRILQVYSRTAAHASLLALELGAEPVSEVSGIERTADLTIIAIRDDSVDHLVEMLGNTRSMLTHTAGALPMDILQPATATFGVLYPLQSLRKEIPSVPPLTILVDGNDARTKTALSEFASGIADTVLEAGDQARLKYHLAATLVNNFTNYLFILSASFCKKENISFAALQNLMEETVSRMRNKSPDLLQTGPAWRNDQITLEKHHKILERYPEISKLYELFTEEIQRFASTGKSL
jgi:predicted short-subunit dehydrogenase-like oxidoreductase (DUF2520 family)